jgi:two-component system nitrogen regulation sensor histidine kinase NtrY
MGSSGAGKFAAGVAVRAILIGALAFAAVAAIAWRNWYATGAVLLVAALIVALTIAQSARSIDRTLAQFVDGLFAEGYERPTAKAPSGQLANAIQRALERLGETRAERQRRLEQLQGLLDTVAAAVVVTDDAGALTYANRSARMRLGEASRLGQLPGLGEAAMEIVLAAPAGSQQVVTLAAGQRALASVSAFDSSEGRRRLIAFQSLSGDLAAVELEAWQSLARILAHEMMNSLTPICSLAESLPAMLPAGLEGGLATDAIEVIARRSRRLMTFAERYRELADLPAPETSPVPAADILASLRTLMTPLMGERGVAFEVGDVAPNLLIQADAELVEQALINLVKNAADAVAGRPDAWVRLSCEAREDGIALVVCDNGPGMAPGRAEEAFTPFFTTKAGGAGIGLPLARQIALGHGGRLQHRPLQPTGAAFEFVLPNG